MQMLIAAFGMISLGLLGIAKAGGLREVIEKAGRGGRLQFFNTEWDPSSGTTLWNVMLGETRSSIESLILNLKFPNLGTVHHSIGDSDNKTC